MTSKSYTNRTTLWDNDVSADPSAPQAIPARGAWRAPSAVLSGDRGGRRVSAIPAVSVEGDDAEDRVPFPRRTNFSVSRSAWWRPRSNFGRILLGTGAFVVIAGLVTVGIVTRNFLTRDVHFRIPGASSIQSTGLSEVNRTDVLPVFGEDIGRNIFFVPLSIRRKQLEAIPWVQQATVMRYLPNHLSINIVERTPVAFVRQGQQVELADADGVILSMPPAMMAQHHYSFPVVTGINAKDSLTARRSRMAVYQRFVSELDQNNQHLTEQVSEIDLSDPEDLRATMPEQGSDILAHFGEDQFLRRLQVYKSHIAEWRGRYPKLIGVDLRYNGEVPLEMSTDGAGPSSAKIPAVTSPRPRLVSPKAPSAASSTPLKTSKTAVKPPAAVPAVSNTQTKSTIAAHKAAEAKKKTAKTKADKAKAEKARAAKAKAAHTKPALHPATHSTTHTSPVALKQG